VVKPEEGNVTTAPVPDADPADPYDVAKLARRMDISAATARRYARRAVTIPDGRQITGWPPGMAGGQLLEHRLRDKLAAQLGGITEANMPYGRPDVLTATTVFEVEPAKNWRHGVSQVLSYSAQTGLPPAIALFGAIHHDTLLKLYLKIRDGMGRANYGTIALWWWAGAAWTPISSRARCRNMPAPGPQ
jgi:hypothetical protein